MTIEEAVWQVLTGDAAVRDLAGDRVYPLGAEQGADLPYLVYERAAQRWLRSLTRRVNLSAYSMHLEAWADSPAAARRLYDAAFDALVDYRGTLDSGAIDVRTVLADDSAESQEPPVLADERGLFSVSLDVVIHYRKGA